MFAELQCGPCESSMQMDSDWEESVWLMVYRFADAHVSCGAFTDRSELPTRASQVVRFAEDEDGSSTGD